MTVQRWSQLRKSLTLTWICSAQYVVFRGRNRRHPTNHEQTVSWAVRCLQLFYDKCGSRWKHHHVTLYRRRRGSISISDIVNLNQFGAITGVAPCHVSYDASAGEKKGTKQRSVRRYYLMEDEVAKYSIVNEHYANVESSMSKISNQGYASLERA